MEGGKAFIQFDMQRLYLQQLQYGVPFFLHFLAVKIPQISGMEECFAHSQVIQGLKSWGI